MTKQVWGYKHPVTNLIKNSLNQVNWNQLFQNKNVNEQAVFLTRILSCRQKNADAKVSLSISCQQKWNLHQQFSKNCIFPNIQLKGVVNRLPPFKNLSDHTNMFLMG